MKLRSSSAEDEFDRALSAMGREQEQAFNRLPTKIQEWIVIAAQPLNCVELLRVYETGQFSDDEVIEVIKFRMLRGSQPGRGLRLS